MCNINMDKKLIEAVRNYISLWDVSSKSYKDAQCKENVWKEVNEKANHYSIMNFGLGRYLGWRMFQALEMFEGPFRERTQKTKQKKTGECGPCYVSRWPFLETMMFLSNSICHRE